MNHELKCWPEPFQAMWVGDKTFEIRRDDRNFKERDGVLLQEWDPEAREYTGREISGHICYLTRIEKFFPGATSLPIVAFQLSGLSLSE